VKVLVSVVVKAGQGLVVEREGLRDVEQIQRMILHVFEVWDVGVARASISAVLATVFEELSSAAAVVEAVEQVAEIMADACADDIAVHTMGPIAVENASRPASQDLLEIGHVVSAEEEDSPGMVAYSFAAAVSVCADQALQDEVV
jgi:hypothetical protein